MPKLGLSGGRPRTRYENGVLPAYAVTPAKKYYVNLEKKHQEIKCAKRASYYLIVRFLEYRCNFSLQYNRSYLLSVQLCIRFYSKYPSLAD